jgi:hypothetical protein
MSGPSASGKGNLVSPDLDVHGRVDQCEKAMSWAHPGKAGLLSIFDSAKKGIDRSFQAIIDLSKQLAVDSI